MTHHQAQRTARRKLRAAARRIELNAASPAADVLPPAIFMTDRAERTPDILGVANQLPPGWAVIYRHFGDAKRREIAAHLANIASRRRLTLLIAADPELARIVGAQGVHWPSRLLPRRGLARSFGLQTASAHNVSELAQAARAGVDAAILSSVFPSQSPSAGAPIGLSRFNAIARDAPLPVYALGGVTADNAARIADTETRSAAGFAAVSSIYDAWK